MVHPKFVLPVSTRAKGRSTFSGTSPAYRPEGTRAARVASASQRVFTAARRVVVMVGGWGSPGQLVDLDLVGGGAAGHVPEAGDDVGLAGLRLQEAVPRLGAGVPGHEDPVGDLDVPLGEQLPVL